MAAACALAIASPVAFAQDTAASADGERSTSLAPVVVSGKGFEQLEVGAARGAAGRPDLVGRRVGQQPEAQLGGPGPGCRPAQQRDQRERQRAGDDGTVHGDLQGMRTHLVSAFWVKAGTPAPSCRARGGLADSRTR